MKHPSHIRVGKHDYCLLFVSELDKGLAGLCDTGRKAIYVSMNQSKSEMEKTLIHELLHAIEAEYKITLGHPKINKLEVALVQVIGQLYRRI